jgi:hypothetical protein
MEPQISQIRGGKVRAVEVIFFGSGKILVMRPDGPAPQGQESLAQGLPWVSRDKSLALKGPEMRKRTGSKARSRFSPYLVAPSGLFRVRGLTRVNSGLCFLATSGHGVEV